MTWPFENDTSAITKKLAKKSLQSEKRRNLMVVIAVALAAFLMMAMIMLRCSDIKVQLSWETDEWSSFFCLG